MGDKEQPKKCFCARCFLPIDAADKVDIEGQNFHRICSMCCVCRTIPKSIKMFYGHVFCAECFKNHVMGRFKGEPRVQTNGWWAEWGPGRRPQTSDKDDSKSENSSESVKRCVCARCLQAVDESVKVDIGGQHFHPMCAKCYFCHTVPKNNLKIYYGQVFCEDCFNRHVLNRGRDNPSEFFKTCFEQWQNAQFAENMRNFMGTSKDSTPFVFCRCSGGEWTQPDTRKCDYSPAATPGNVSTTEDESIDTWDLSFENRTEVSEVLGSTPKPTAAEKIEKLTKYLHGMRDAGKKWKNFVESDRASLTSFGWVDLRERRDLPIDTRKECPKCLWQCGAIYVSRDLLPSGACDAFE